MTVAESIEAEGRVLAFVIRAHAETTATTFVTSPEMNFQAGFIVHPQGHKIPRHRHPAIRREVAGTAEALLVRRGRCRVDFYDGQERPVTSRELRAGDVMVLLSGGHGFEMLEDTVLLEIKQGPYTAASDKERF
ncbi:MAG: hypothetical protein HY903_01665 [Deltaproteobacteria bacterium]|nr:hypothetical protein [Deltaproteobacteria bacterium]